MPYTIPSFDDTRDRILRDTRNIDATAPTDVDSDNYIRATATASAAEGLYDHQAWMVRQIIPDTSDPEYLEQHCALRGITRRPATKATGSITVTGRPSAVVPAYTQAKDADGTLYQTTTAITLAGEGETVTAAAPCEAVQAGALPDVEGVTVTLVSAPSGVQAKAALNLTGGTDAESNASMLTTLLDYMRNPPAGGTAADYRRWARSVPGVADATVYPLRQGPGTVDIVIVGEDGIPGEDVVTACQAKIDAERPCTAKAAKVYAPVPKLVAVTLALRVGNGSTLVTLKPAVTTVLQAEFARLAPGEGLVLSRLVAAVSSLDGVADVIIRHPEANVAPSALEWCRLSDLTLEAF